MAAPGTYRESLGRRIWQAKYSYLMLAPFTILFVLFTVLPVAIAIWFSFTNYDMLHNASFTGLENYMRMFLDDDVFLIALKNTLIFALVTGPISYFMCFFFAWLINELKPALRAVATLVFYAPVLSGSVFTVWQFILSPDRYGMLNGFLINLGIMQTPVSWLLDTRYIMTSLIIVQLWMSLGTGFLAFIAGLQGVDTTLYEAASIDGVRNRFQELWYVTLPQMAPQMMFGAVMQIVSSFTVGSISIALAGQPSTEYAGETIVTQMVDYGTTRYEMGYACAIACFLFFMMYVSKRGVNKILSRVGH